MLRDECPNSWFPKSQTRGTPSLPSRSRVKTSLKASSKLAIIDYLLEYGSQSGGLRKGTLQIERRPLHSTQLEQTTGSSGRRGTGPPTEPGFSQAFVSILSPMECWFLAAITSGMLSWRIFISSKIIDLIAQILFKLN